MPRDIVVVGTSAGGVEALGTLVAGLPSNLPAAVFVVLHVGRGRSLLPGILDRTSRMPVRHALDGDPIRHGRILVAPPDMHMTLDEQAVRLTHGPAENGSRPAIDPLFRSAAQVFGQRVIGVILTGSLDDGVAGLKRVKQQGGIVIVQDPHDASVPSMPAAALRHVSADFVAPLDRIPTILQEVIAGASDRRSREGGAMAGGEGARERETGRVSTLTCPACSGALWEVDETGLLQFRCRVGHVYSTDAMLSEQAESLDRALWAGLRALEERGALHERLAAFAHERGQWRAAEQFRTRARQVHAHARTLRTVITQSELTAFEEGAAEDDTLPEPSDVPS